MNLAVSDIGSNSVRLLVAKCDEKGITVIKRSRVVSRLGETVDNYLTETAINKTITALKHFKEIAAAYEAKLVKIVATSAAREAVNGQELLQRIKQECCLRAQIISGQQEAEYTYNGVLAVLAPDLRTDILAVDLGGGSTEFIWQKNDSKLAAYSLPLGAVRMTQTGATVEQIAAVVQQIVPEVIRQKPKRLVGSGGTITTLAAAVQRLKNYDIDRIQGYILARSSVAAAAASLQQKSVAEIKSLPGISPDRADIITAGAVIVQTIMQQLDYQEIIISEADILQGLLLEANSSSKQTLSNYHN